MTRPGDPGLVPLRDATGRGTDAHARLEARLRASWLLVVGPALVHNTRLLRLHREVLVVGCWEPHIIPNLRRSAAATWPQLRERLTRMWRHDFRSMEIVPCDPPVAAPPRPAREPDAFKAVLAILRNGHKG